jgi:dihydropteroate synthase
MIAKLALPLPKMNYTNIHTINCRGKLLSLEIPVAMGILNYTPDSFFDGGKYDSIEKSLERIEQMLADGAKIIDIGGQSTRPGAEDVGETEELKRIIPIIEKAVNHFPEIIISVDTYRSRVAREAVEAGASIVNDISGGNLDSAMFQTVADLKCAYILMHMQGTPQTMQNNPQYQNVTLDIIRELSEKINMLKALKVHDIILDPGFGFGKTIEQNFQLLRELDLFEKTLQLPVLAGLSRKSMLWKTLNTTPENALYATTAANILALVKGARILRVHDVKEAADAIAIYKASGIN